MFNNKCIASTPSKSYSSSESESVSQSVNNIMRHHLFINSHIYSVPHLHLFIHSFTQANRGFLTMFIFHTLFSLFLMFRRRDQEDLLYQCYCFFFIEPMPQVQVNIDNELYILNDIESISLMQWISFANLFTTIF